MKKLINIPDDWYRHLQPTIESDYFKSLGAFIQQKRKEGEVFPESSNVFRAFNETPLGDVRVVVLGMDPYPNLYHGKPVACGLAFAPADKNYMPPSLRMIYGNLKETVYQDTYNFPEDLDIANWSKQGVFLLNAALTVEHGKAGSHLAQWKKFTEEVIQIISASCSGVIFCFWGKDAQKFSGLVNPKFHYILTAPHPVSAVYKGGKWECNHFQKINEILIGNNGDTIKWLTF
jgi:uracil-DNA glycosylase